MQDRIPIFFSSCGKENGHSWSKEKTLRGELTGKAVNSPKAGAGRHALPTKSGSRLPAALYPNIKSAYPRTCGCRAKWRAKPNRRISAPVRSASLRTTRSVSCFILVSRPSSPWGLVFPSPSLVSGRGVPKVNAPKRRRGRIKRPASEEMARLAAHQGWESCCRDGACGLLPRPLGVGFQRRGPRPPAFVSLGVQSEVETP